MLPKVIIVRTTNSTSMKYLLLIASCFVIVNCSRNTLEVNQYHLKGAQNLSRISQTVRGEALYRYDQNLLKKDREQKHGHYYTFRWDKKAIKQNGAPPILEFRYRQSATGQTPRLVKKTLPLNGRPITEISITGESYKKRGRILSWQALLKQGDKTLAKEQSFLWE